MTSLTSSDVVEANGKEFWDLRLYVAGQSPKSLSALSNLTKLCEEYLHGCSEIQIIDLVEDPALAQRDDILAIPTLIISRPLPVRRIVGDLSNTERVLVGLRVQAHMPK